LFDNDAKMVLSELEPSEYYVVNVSRLSVYLRFKGDKILTFLSINYVCFTDFKEEFEG
jgi:hypothetical protein